jgi:hypothetical protein
MSVWERVLEVFDMQGVAFFTRWVLESGDIAQMNLENCIVSGFQEGGLAITDNPY